ncbi:MAG: hypothetical protein ACJAYU_005172 [Bradymonadia bacterium]|jgi:hypothetical protein
MGVVRHRVVRLLLEASIGRDAWPRDKGADECEDPASERDFVRNVVGHGTRDGEACSNEDQRAAR